MKGVQSEYPWQPGPEWGQWEGLVAVLDIDGHRFEIHKVARLSTSVRGAISGIKAPRYYMVVDGKRRGSETRTLASRINEADGMVSWARLEKSLPTPEPRP